MNFQSIHIEGAYLIGLQKFSDDREFFARGYCEKEFAGHGIDFKPVQANIGYSEKKYTLRGMHYQTGEHAESKLVRCTKGAVYDVILDMRPGSPTYKQWQGVELTADNGLMLYLPAGCAHGYQTLQDHSEVFYMVSAFYAPDHEKGVRWDDPAFRIDWKETDEIIISDKDASWPDFEERSPEELSADRKL